MGTLLVLATVLAYQPVWHAGFTWDDDRYVTANPLLVEPNGWEHIWFSSGAPQYYPLVFTSFRLERALWGLNPAGYHCVNILLHAASAVLLWRLLRRLGVPGAWLAGAIFALHPVNVASVAWVTERKNVLCMVFYLLSLLLYLRSEALPDAKVEDGGWRMEDGRWKMAKGRLPFSVLHSPSSLFYRLSVLAFILALFSKTAVAPLPFVLLGLAWWRRGRIGREDLWRSVPFFAAALILGLITVWFERQQTVGGFARADSLWGRLAGAGWAIWFYLFKALLPVHLSFVYPLWKINAGQALSYLPVLLVAAGFLLCWRYRRGWGKAGLLGGGYFVLMLLPVLGFVSINFMQFSLVADHWQYFAILGPITLMATALTAAGEALGRVKPGLGVAPGGAVLLALGVLTWNQAHIHADAETLWRDTLVRNPACLPARYNLGQALAEKGQTDEAIIQFQEAINLKPDLANAHTSLGNALLTKGQTNEAIGQYQEAIRVEPDDALAYNNLGYALLRKGQIEEAIGQFQQALRLQPGFTLAQGNLATALEQKAQTAEAISRDNEAIGLEQTQEAVRLNPDDPQAHYNLGNALARNNRMDEAIRQYQEALRLKPDSFQPHLALALILPRAGRLKDAAIQMEEFLRTCPPRAWKRPTAPSANRRWGL